VANVYVYSAAGGAGTGADWANAYTTLSAALTAKAAGDDFWVANDHSESTASAVTLTSPGTNANPCRIMCVNRAGSVPPVSADLTTGAIIATTGNNALTVAGAGYWEGITFNCGTTGVSPNLTISSTAHFVHLKNCALAILSTGAFSNIRVGQTTGTKVILENTTVSFGDVGHVVRNDAYLNWRNTASAIVGAVIPTSLLRAGGPALLEGVDLSALGSGKNIVASTGIAASAYAVLKDCKLGASVTVTPAPTSPGHTETLLIRCDSGDTNYRHEKYAYQGTQTTETTIVRTGGASDGTTPISWKIITTANSKRYMPFECMPISIWNEDVGSPLDITVEGIWGGGAVPTNADIWMDVEYLGTSGFPRGSVVSSGPADQLAAGTNLTASSETWGGSTTDFKLEATITPAEKGPITVYVKAATASTTFYIDPKITVS
jgi:hypothetical protein